MRTGKSAGILHLHLDEPLIICSRCISSNFYFYYYCTSIKGDAIIADKLNGALRKAVLNEIYFG